MSAVDIYTREVSELTKAINDLGANFDNGESAAELVDFLYAMGWRNIKASYSLTREDEYHVTKIGDKRRRRMIDFCRSLIWSQALVAHLDRARPFYGQGSQFESGRGLYG